MADQSTGSTAAALSNVSHPRNENFVGRSALLAELRREMTSSHRVQSIHGLGGIGKTQTALEFAHLHRADYAIIWWIRGDTQESIAAGYSKLAARLGRHLSVDAPPDLICQTLGSLLVNKTSLLILDGVADFSAVQPFLLAGKNIHTLITSRSATWPAPVRGQPLKVLERGESVAFLLRRGKRTESTPSAERLAAALGDLPLALEQAAACIRQTNLSFDDYLRKFETEWAQLLMDRHQSTEYPSSVAMTWGLAFAAVEQTSPASADLLNFCSYLCPDRVTLKMLREGSTVLPGRLGQMVNSAEGWNRTVAPLLDYSLVDVDEQQFTVHRLVATVTRDRLDATQRASWCSAAISFLSGAFLFDSSDVASWTRCGELLPHVLEATAHADVLSVMLEESAKLLNDAGRFLLKRGQFTDAKNACELAMSLVARRYGHTHPKLSSIANNLGRALEGMGNDAAALQYFAQALTIDESAYGHTHPHVAEVINNYGICMQKKGDRHMARQQFEWAAQVYEAHYGPDHQKLAHILNNLGYALKSIGDVQAAQLNLLRALTIAEMNVGPNHPTTARILYNLASVQRLLHQLPAAREYLQRALTIDQATLGPNHPDIAADCSALSEVLVLMGQTAAAQEYTERAARIESANKTASRRPAMATANS